MEKILISACLTGACVRYDGNIRAWDHPLLRKWQARDQVVPFCPEVAGGLPVPRPPVEIVQGDGRDVLDGTAVLQTRSGDDMTASFLAGAQKTLDEVRRYQINLAILKERSPSCGSTWIYDGTFQGRLIPGMGVTTAVLMRAGVKILSEIKICEIKYYIKQNFI
jgi:uncharacterized protein YbbK (DUF523 family)